ncbi:hypothetical protein GF340_00590 [Candidatus Peregrinibacteria bacterium]|nr:hypothetical protein [Candidatus Peregrinibacteria bacterium]
MENNIEKVFSRDAEKTISQNGKILSWISKAVTTAILATASQTATITEAYADKAPQAHNKKKLKVHGCGTYFEDPKERNKTFTDIYFSTYDALEDTAKMSLYLSIKTRPYNRSNSLNVHVQFKDLLLDGKPYNSIIKGIINDPNFNFIYTSIDDQMYRNHPSFMYDTVSVTLKNSRFEAYIKADDSDYTQKNINMSIYDNKNPIREPTTIKPNFYASITRNCHTIPDRLLPKCKITCMGDIDYLQRKVDAIHKSVKALYEAQKAKEAKSEETIKKEF